MNNEVIIRPATAKDLQAVHALIGELAAFERAAHEFEVTLEELTNHAFGEKPIVEIRVADWDGYIAGAALVYEKYSTWKGIGLHLEDLIVREDHRGKGIGAKLFEDILRLCRERNYARLEWQVLDWNETAIKFYQKYGAEMMKEWLTCRLTSEDFKSY